LDIICPLCHNRLPDNYAEAKELKLAVIGNTEAGKTFYFTALCHALIEAKIIDDKGISELELARNLIEFRKSMYCTVNTEFTSDSIKDFIKPTSLDPRSRDQLAMPYIFPCRGTKKGETIDFNAVFYDIAGEKCAGNKAAQWLQERAKYLNEVDGIIFVIESSEINNKKNINAYAEIIDKICRHLYNINMEKIPKPVAVAFSKADKVMDLRDKFSKYATNDKKSPYNSTVYDSSRRENIIHDTKGFLKTRDEDGIIIDMIRDNFSNAAYYCFFSSVDEQKPTDGKASYCSS
jgi:signal recognition particle receptor subunit beta